MGTSVHARAQARSERAWHPPGISRQGDSINSGAVVVE